MLSVFGGAGPQHACAIARSLGIEHLVVNRFSSLLSAYGLGLADEKEEIQVLNCPGANSDDVGTM